MNASESVARPATRQSSQLIDLDKITVGLSYRGRIPVDGDRGGAQSRGLKKAAAVECRGLYGAEEGRDGARGERGRLFVGNEETVGRGGVGAGKRDGGNLAVLKHTWPRRGIRVAVGKRAVVHIGGDGGYA